LQDEVTRATTDVAVIKTKQDDHALAVQKATQAIADLAILVAGGASGNSAAVTALQTRLTALETSKADKTQLDPLTKSVTDLEAALKLGATDQEVADAIAVVDKTITDLETALKAADDALAAKIKVNADNIQKNKDAIAELQKKAVAVIRYTTDGVVSDVDHRAVVAGAVALKLPKATLDRVIEFDMLQSPSTPVLTAETGEQFFVADGDKVVPSTDEQGTLDAIHSQVFLFGRDTGGWDVIAGGAGKAPATSLVYLLKSVIVVLPELPASTWTTIPALPAEFSSAQITDFEVLDSVGREITETIEVEPDGSTWKLWSLVKKTNLQIKYFILTSTTADSTTAQSLGLLSKPVIVPLLDLPASTWTTFPPLPTGFDNAQVVRFDVLDPIGRDIEWTIEVEPIGTTWRAWSLVKKTNLQIKYFLGAK